MHGERERAEGGAGVEAGVERDLEAGRGGRVDVDAIADREAFEGSARERAVGGGREEEAEGRRGERGLQPCGAAEDEVVDQAAGHAEAGRRGGRLGEVEGHEVVAVEREREPACRGGGAVDEIDQVLHRGGSGAGGVGGIEDVEAAQVEADRRAVAEGEGQVVAGDEQGRGDAEAVGAVDLGEPRGGGDGGGGWVGGAAGERDRGDARADEAEGGVGGGGAGQVGGYEAARLDRKRELARRGHQVDQILHGGGAAGEVEGVEVEAERGAVAEGEGQIVAGDQGGGRQPCAAVDLREERGSGDRGDVGRGGDAHAGGDVKAAGEVDRGRAVGGEGERQAGRGDRGCVKRFGGGEHIVQRQGPLEGVGGGIPGEGEVGGGQAEVGGQPVDHLLHRVKGPLAVGVLHGGHEAFELAGEVVAEDAGDVLINQRQFEAAAEFGHPATEVGEKHAQIAGGDLGEVAEVEGSSAGDREAREGEFERCGVEEVGSGDRQLVRGAEGLVEAGDVEGVGDADIEAGAGGGEAHSREPVGCGGGGEFAEGHPAGGRLGEVEGHADVESDVDGRRPEVDDAEAGLDVG